MCEQLTYGYRRTEHLMTHVGDGGGGGGCS